VAEESQGSNLCSRRLWFSRHPRRICLTRFRGDAKFFLHAEVAQLVEQPIRNRQVIGSIPILGSISFVFISV
jgi:hypothetical protein